MRRRKLVTILMGIVMMLPFFLGLGEVREVMAAPINENAELILHKKKMTSEDKFNNKTPNTGGDMEGTGGLFSEYEGMDDVTFTVYDVTADYYEKYADTKSQDEALDFVKNISNKDLNESYIEIDSGITANGGIVSFEVPKQSDDNDAVYLIVEEPKDGVIASDRMVVSFPVIVYDETAEKDVELDTIHLYPKNLVSADGSLKVIKKGTANGEGLNDAEFVISKLDSTGKPQYISGAKDGLYLWQAATATTGYKFITGNSYAPGDSAITETKNDNKGDLFVNGLEVGSYKLTETKAPTGAEMIDEHTVNTFEITSTGEQVEKIILNDTIEVDKVAPYLTIDDGDGRKSVGIGELIDYEISANIPLGIGDKISDSEYRYTTFKLTDTHDTALTFTNKDYKLVMRDPATKVESSVTDYSVSPNEDGNGFVVSVGPDYIPSLTGGYDLVFKYQMYLNDTANPDTGFNNIAAVVAGSLSDKTDPITVHTGGKRFIKIDQDNKATLVGAKFIVTRTVDDATEYLVMNDSTKAITWENTDTNAYVFETVKDVEGMEDGVIDIKGLRYGEYTLKEIAAPNDYILPEEGISFTIGFGTYGSETSLVDPDPVPNKHKGSLPSTGGSGIVAFILIGVVAVGGAVLYFTKGRRQIEG